MDRSTTSALERFSWACCVSDPVFIYVYGQHVVCQQLSTVLACTVLPKGVVSSLAESQACAEAAAESLGRVYADIGTVRAMPVEAFLRELSTLPGRFQRIRDHERWAG